MSLPNLEKAMDDAAVFVQATWQQAVMGSTKIPGLKELTSNIALRQKYADSIVLGSKLGGGSALARQILATAQIAVDLEYGKGPWDMKPMLLGGKKVKIGKNGARYVTIPFRHGAAGGNANSHFKSMPQDVYAAAKLLKNGQTLGANVLKNHAAKTHTIAKNMKTGQQLAQPINYQHTASIYAGMKKVEQKYGKVTQAKYMTFRRVSENSDSQAWWHPGYPAQYITKAVADFCRPLIEKKLLYAARLDLTSIEDISVGMRVVAN